MRAARIANGTALTTRFTFYSRVHDLLSGSPIHVLSTNDEANEDADRHAPGRDRQPRAAFQDRRGCPAVEGALKLNPIDVQALLFIADHPGCTASVVGQHLGVVATTTSALLDRLVRYGLVLRERVESNRRIVHLSLRAAGQERVKRLIETANAHCRAMLEVLAPEERAPPER